MCGNGEDFVKRRPALDSTRNNTVVIDPKSHRQNCHDDMLGQKGGSKTDSGMNREAPSRHEQGERTDQHLPKTKLQIARRTMIVGCDRWRFRRQDHVRHALEFRCPTFKSANRN